MLSVSLTQKYHYFRWVVPGSMQSDLTNGAGRFPRANLVQLPKDGVGQPEGAIPVLVPANSCMIFDRRLWHAQSPNYSQAERLVLFMGYGARWLKARDAMYVEDAMAMTTCPLRRQMLGYTTQNSGLYHVRAVYFLRVAVRWQSRKASPSQGNGLDVPLRAWLRSHDCNEGLGFQLAVSAATLGPSIASG